MSGRAIRVLLADDEIMIRAGLRLVLETEPDIVVVGEAGDGAAAVAATAALHPDVVLMDVRMPGLDGLAATRRILEGHPAVRVVVLTTFDDDANVHAALRLGASGFLLKVAPPERLVDAIRVAADGGALLDPLVTRRVISAFSTLPEPGRRPRPPALDRLTDREHEVLRMLARGLSNAEIAAELVVGEATVKTHVARVLMKLDLRDRVQAVVFAYEHGLVEPGA
ncbi:response regulator transcription factor [Pseudonocardia humida]|uniref:Response regulator transcription factor n=1 Tax=Pseudonocardia humida TaxID=2800819 RepID=A0ABT0ZW32_9PSEU|nr:response regulator transcription factor [Pseudonocardia humida]MCO1654869.1 response regulator transcription factor [Pseudonocardia humida]